MTTPDRGGGDANGGGGGGGGSPDGDGRRDAAGRGSVLEADGVIKRYETGGETLTALKGIDLRVEPGEFLSVMGPSGSGKSTLLNLLGLLDTPTEGVVTLSGTDVTTLSDRERTAARKRTVGFVFQNFYLISTLTAAENVEIPRLLDRDPETPGRARELLSNVGLGDRFDHRPDQLSGGQKQRVAIARALVNEPRILLADEPTGNLDRRTGRTVLEQFREVCGEGVAVVAVTHDNVVTEYTDRDVTLVDGELFEGPFREVDRKMRRGELERPGGARPAATPGDGGSAGDGPGPEDGAGAGVADGETDPTADGADGR